MKKFWITFQLLFTLGITYSAEDGNSCSSAYTLTESATTDYTFNEEQSTMYFSFESGEEQSFEFKATPTTLSPFISISSFKIYEFEECSSLTLVYESFDYDTPLPKDSNYWDALPYNHMITLSDNSNYLIEISRSNDFPEAYFSFGYFPTILPPCPTSYNTSCNVIKNFKFDIVKPASPPQTVNNSWFRASNVCGWDFGDYTPDVDISGSNHWARLMSCHNGNFTPVPYGVESIIQDIGPLNTSKQYILTFKIKKPPLNRASEDFGIHLINSSSIPNKNSSNSGRVGSVYNISPRQVIFSANNSQIPNTATYYSVCFTPNSSYDMIMIYADDLPPSNTTYGGVYITEVDLKEFDFDIGPDVYGGCPAKIGPTCPIRGATFSWSPTAGLSDPTVKNPIANPTVNTTYSLTVSFLNAPTCSTITKSVYVEGGNSTLIYDHYVDGQVTDSDLKAVTGYNPGSPDEIVGKTIYIKDRLRIVNNLKLKNCNLYLGPGAFIEISGADLYIETPDNTSDYFIKSCRDDVFWDGIKVSGQTYAGLFITGSLKNGKNNLKISNMTNGIQNREQAEMNLSYVAFDRNKLALDFVNENPLFKSLVRSCTFDCSSPLEYSNSNQYYPEFAIKIENFRKYVATSSILQDLIFEKVVISDEAYLDGRAGGIKVTNSDFSIEDYEFRNYVPSQFGLDRQITAIQIYSHDHEYRTLSPNFPNYNKPKNEVVIKNSFFLDNRNSIYISSTSIEELADIDLELTDNVFDNTSSSFGNVGIALNRVKGRSISSYNLIKENDFYDLTTGIEALDCEFLHIDDNVFDMEVQPGTTYTTRSNNYSRAVYLDNTDYENLLKTPGFNGDYAIKLTLNEILHAKIGIESNLVYSLIKDNDILDMNDNKTYGGSGSCGGVSNPPCPPRGYGIRAMNTTVDITQNKIENDLAEYSPDPYQDATANNLVAISIENVFNGSSNSDVVCNKVKNFGLGLSFNGTCGNVNILNNNIIDQYYGFSIDNDSDLGDVGSNSSNGGAENDWSGNFNGSETYVFEYDPQGNGAPIHYYYSVSPNTNPTNAEPGYSAMSKVNVSGANTNPCVTPSLSNGNRPEKNNLISKSGRLNRNRRFFFKPLNGASDSSRALNQQLVYWQLRGSVRDSFPNIRNILDSLDLTLIGRLGDSLNIRRLPLLKGYKRALIDVNNAMFELRNSGLTTSNRLKLKKWANSCPYDNGIGVYIARRILIEANIQKSFDSDCELMPQRNSPQLRISDSTATIWNNSFALYPNPTNGGLVTLEMEYEQEDLVELIIYQLDGKIFMRKFLKSSLETLDISTAQSGMYLFEVIKNGELYKNGKFVIR